MALTPVNGPQGPLNVGALLTGIVNPTGPSQQPVGPWTSPTGPLAPPLAGGNPTGVPVSYPQPPAPAAPQSAPATPPPAQPDAGGNGGGFNLGLINTFPGVADSLALEQSGISQLDANLNAARQRAIINFGDPALASMAGFGLDPQAGTFAQQNYLSGNATLARLDKAHQQAAQQIINGLVSHGILNSGDLGYREGQENQGYGNTVYDAQQSVLGQLADLFNNYLSSRYGLESNANSAKLQALQSYLSNPDAFATLFNGGSTAGGGSTGGGTSGATAPNVGALLTGIVNPRAKTTAASTSMRKALGGGGRPSAAA